MQPTSILFVFLLACITLFTMTYTLSINTNQEKEIESSMAAADQRLKRSLANKRFYDFGSRSVHSDNDADFQEFNDQFNEHRRFYDFGTKKRFYDFGSKKKRSNE